MNRDDEDDARRPRPAPRHTLGETLDTLSVEELRARIASLQAESARLDAAIHVKEASRGAADAVFKR